MTRAALAALAAASLAACGQDAADPKPAPMASKATPGPPAKASIIRADVEVEREAAPMAPLDLRIGFGEGGANLSQAALAALEQALASEQMRNGGAITLGGHSDSGGTDAANISASRQRAEAVRDWLVDHGVDPERITVIAFGEQNPVAPNALANGEPDEQGRARNRRVEMTVAVPAGSAPAATASEETTLVDELTDEE